MAKKAIEKLIGRLPEASRSPSASNAISGPDLSEKVYKLNRVIVFHITQVTVINSSCCIEQYVDYWREMAMAFGMDRAYCVNLSNFNTDTLPRYPFITYVSDFREVTDLGYTLVVLDKNGADLLQNFQHPVDNVAYLAWPDEQPGQSENTRIGDFNVKIPTKIDKRLGHLSLWSIQAMGIVLYDRMVKLG
jgi:hypothetical protein